MSISRRALMPILFGLAMVSSDMAGAAVGGADLYRVTGVASWDWLNMRAGPSAGYRIVGRIPHDGRYVEGLGACAGHWCRMRYAGVIGWVHTGHLVAEEPEVIPPVAGYRVVGVAWGDVLNIRTGPSVHNPVIGAIPPDGTGVVPAGGCEGAWCRIRYAATFGWVHSRYLAPVR